MIYLVKIAGRVIDAQKHHVLAGDYSTSDTPKPVEVWRVQESGVAELIERIS